MASRKGHPGLAPPSVLPALAGLAAWREWERSADDGFGALVRALGTEDAATYARLLLATSAHIDSLVPTRK